jgi:ribose transport system ATP-binding protein
VEIAKALSFESRVLIMDEPTSALNDAEIADLFRIIRELKARGVGIIYISHKMDELKQISDRVTVLRDGEYVATVLTRTTSVEAIISMMVGRTLTDALRSESLETRGDVALEVRNLNCGPLVRDVSFVLRKGEILGFAGLMGAGRTEVARAVFGADRLSSGEIFVNGSKAAIKSPSHAVARGIGYLSEDRKRFGLATGMDVESNVVQFEEVLIVRVFPAQAQDSRNGRRFRRPPQHTHAVHDAGSAASLGRQSAKNRRREMARARLRHPVFR